MRKIAAILISGVLITGCAAPEASVPSETEPTVYKPALEELTKTSEPNQNFEATPTCVEETSIIDIPVDKFGWPTLGGMEDVDDKPLAFWYVLQTGLDPLVEVLDSNILVDFSRNKILGPVDTYLRSIFVDPNPDDPVIFLSGIEDLYYIEDKNPDVAVYVPDLFEELQEMSDKQFLYNESSASQICQFMENSTVLGYGYSMIMGKAKALAYYSQLFGDPQNKDEPEKMYCSNFDPNSEDFLLYTKHAVCFETGAEVLKAIEEFNTSNKSISIDDYAFCYPNRVCADKDTGNYQEYNDQIDVIELESSMEGDEIAITFKIADLPALDNEAFDTEGFSWSIYFDVDGDADTGYDYFFKGVEFVYRLDYVVSGGGNTGNPNDTGFISTLSTIPDYPLWYQIAQPEFIIEEGTNTIRTNLKIPGIQEKSILYLATNDKRTKISDLLDDYRVLIALGRFGVE